MIVMYAIAKKRSYIGVYVTTWQTSYLFVEGVPMAPNRLTKNLSTWQYAEEK